MVSCLPASEVGIEGKSCTVWAQNLCNRWTLEFQFSMERYPSKGRHWNFPRIPPDSTFTQFWNLSKIRTLHKAPRVSFALGFRTVRLREKISVIILKTKPLKYIFKHFGFWLGIFDLKVALFLFPQVAARPAECFQLFLFLSFLIVARNKKHDTSGEWVARRGVRSEFVLQKVTIASHRAHEGAAQTAHPLFKTWWRFLSTWFHQTDELLG